MKKILSVVLAVMMIFGALSMGASAVKNYEVPGTGSTIVVPDEFKPDQHVLLIFNSMDCVIESPLYAYVDGKGGDVQGKSGIFYVIVSTNDMNGFTYRLPKASAPEGYNFNGWECWQDEGSLVSGGSNYQLPVNTTGAVLNFYANSSLNQSSGDTLGTILGVLTKVFGAIIGILLYGGDTEAGVAMMDKILGGLSL